jgi:hypothetical protein
VNWRTSPLRPRPVTSSLKGRSGAIPVTGPAVTVRCRPRPGDAVRSCVVGYKHLYKICADCHVRKQVVEFYQSGAGKTDSYCRLCRHRRDEGRSAKKYARRDPVRYRDYKLRTTYGITLDEYNRMHAAQEGLCAVCLRPEVRRAYGDLPTLSVDHNHFTGQVRGLVCAGCNLKIGVIEDDQIVRRIYEYLARTDSAYGSESPNRLS